MKTILPLGMLFLFVCAGCYGPVMGSADAGELPSEVETALNAIFQHTEAGVFQSESVTPLIEFLATFDPAHSEGTVLRERFEAEGSLLAFFLNTDLNSVIRTIDPGLPGYFHLPGLIRISGWREGGRTDDGQLLRNVANTPGVHQVRGVEFEASTPGDGGVTYVYDMNRLVGLFSVDGDRVLVSVAKQKDVSSLGKRAVALDSENWNFFYSGLDGQDVSGLSWADSYIYDSASVQIFLEKAAEPGRVQVLYLKWLRAGWRGLNVVGQEELFKGQVDFAKAMRLSFEGPWISMDRLSALGSILQSIPEDVLTRWTARYALAFEQLALPTKLMKQRAYRKILEIGKYAHVLDHDQRVALLGVESLKCLLGRPALADPCTDPQLASMINSTAHQPETLTVNQ